VGLTFTLAGCSGKTPEERLERADVLMQQRDTLAATLEAREIIKKFPDHPETVKAHMLLAQIYMTEGRPDEALSELETVLEKEPQSTQIGRDTLRNYLSVLKQLQQYEQAFKAIDNYQSKYANDEGTSLNLTVARADMMTAAEQTTGAREILTNLRETTTSPAERGLYRRMIAATYSMDQNPTATLDLYLKDYAETTDMATKQEIAGTLANFYAQKEDYPNLRQWVKEATDIYEKNATEELDANRRTEMAMQLAMFYTRVNNIDGALKIMQNLWDGQVGHDFVMPVTQVYASVLLRAGKYDEALAFMHEIATKYPEMKVDGEVARLETLKAQNDLQNAFPPDTSTLAMKFYEDPLVPEMAKTAAVIEAKDSPTSATTTEAGDAATTAGN
jgi:tetratricopeptide (TPR) repeat protein